MLAALKDQEEGVRASAVEALRKIGADPSVVVPALIEVLKDRDASVRRSVAGTLGQLAPAKAAVPALTEALKDEDAEVRQEAARALKQIDPEASKKAERR